MKIIIISAVYPPEPGVAGRMVRDLAKFLKNEGHAIHLVAPFPSRPLGVKYLGFEEQSKSRTTDEDGVQVTRLVSFTKAESTLIGRARESWSFGRAAAGWLRLNGQEGVVIYEVNWPLFAKHFVGKAASVLGIPRVTTVMDVYPESLLEKLPGFVGCFVRWPMIAWDRAIVHEAQKLVVISEGQKDLYLRTRGLAEERVEVVHTWQDESLFLEQQDRVQSSVKYQVSCEAFSFMYMGNIGPVAGVEHLIRSFYQAQIPSAQLLIAGSGSQKAGCVDLVQRLGVPNVRFITEPDLANVAKVQSLADVFLLPVRKGAAFSSIPSKLGAYMFSAKPILATVDGNSATSKAIIDSRGGWVGPPENQDWLAGMMREVAEMDTSELEKIGGRARVYGLSLFSKTLGVSRLAEIILRTGRLRASES